jgi:GT2 family glycosyltransferase|tara:strand:- start:814 stop:1938 length:1125 start_codon:yes stop_codon:yes gene_type:complete
MRHTVIVPSYNTLEHTKNTYESLLLYGGDVDIIIIDDASDDGTDEWLQSLENNNLTVIIDKERKGHTYWYDEGMRRAKTDIVSILHSDMIIGPDYFENMLKHLQRGKVVCATRIEPPIHPEGKEKLVRNFGVEANEFMWSAFETFCLEQKNIEKDKTTKGIFAPWMLYKEDHLNIGGHDQRFAPFGYEDSDIFNRWIQAGYEMVQARDAFCYHMTCRGHRWNKGVGIENPDYRSIMDRCRKEFIRKWGDWIQNDEYQHPIIWKKYDRGIVLSNDKPELLEMLEPWADTLYTSLDYKDYIEKEQVNTVTNLWDRIVPFDNEKNNEILIEVDGDNFTQQDFIYIQKLAEILDTQSIEAGRFKLGNLIIEKHEFEEV